MNNYPYFGYAPQQATQDERIWVQSAQAAESYLVAPNSFVRLWNTNLPEFYEKRADATGRPLPMETYTYANKRVQQPTTADNDSPYTLLEEQLKAVIQRVDALETGINKKTTKKGVENE